MTFHLMALLSFALGLTAPARVQQAPPTAPGQGLTVVVQVVDAVWLPVPGARVALRDEASREVLASAFTAAEGRLRLSPPPSATGATFTLTTTMPGFAPQRIEHRRFGPCGSRCAERRYLQVQLEAGGGARPVPATSRR